MLQFVLEVGQESPTHDEQRFRLSQFTETYELGPAPVALGPVYHGGGLPDTIGWGKSPCDCKLFRVKLRHRASNLPAHALGHDDGFAESPCLV